MSENGRGPRADVGWQAGTADADIVLRERRIWWAPATALVGWVLVKLAHPDWGWVISATDVVVFVGAVAVVLVAFVLYPAWIRIGSHGIEYGQWFQQQRFLWGEIDSFALGNPGRPENAYVLVRGKVESAAPRPVILPFLTTHSPEELVSLLREKQRLFRESRAARNGVEHEEGRGAVAMRDYYGVLKLPSGASEPVIRQRFKRLAKHLHPDVNPSPDAASQFREIREAFEVLTDPAQRATVDSWYARQARPVGRTQSSAAATRSPSVSAPAGGAQSPFVPRRGQPISPVWAAGSDRLWNFGCFAPLGFVAAFVVASIVSHELSTAVLAGVAVALAGGIIAAIGGERVREWLLWILSWGSWNW